MGGRDAEMQRDGVSFVGISFVEIRSSFRMWFWEYTEGGNIAFRNTMTADMQTSLPQTNSRDASQRHCEQLVPTFDCASLPRTSTFQPHLHPLSPVDHDS